MAHKAVRFRASFSVKSVIDQHLRDLHVFFGDSILYFFIRTEVLLVMARGAGHTKLT